MPAMEFMNGGKLTSLIDRRVETGFTEPEIAYLCRELLQGLVNGASLKRKGAPPMGFQPAKSLFSPALGEFKNQASCSCVARRAAGCEWTFSVLQLHSSPEWARIS